MVIVVRMTNRGSLSSIHDVKVPDTFQKQLHYCHWVDHEACSCFQDLFQSRMVDIKVKSGHNDSDAYPSHFTCKQKTAMVRFAHKKCMYVDV